MPRRRAHVGGVMPRRRTGCPLPGNECPRVGTAARVPGPRSAEMPPAREIPPVGTTFACLIQQVRSRVARRTVRRLSATPSPARFRSFPPVSRPCWARRLAPPSLPASLPSLPRRPAPRLGLFARALRDARHPRGAREPSIGRAGMGRRDLLPPLLPPSFPPTSPPPPGRIISFGRATSVACRASVSSS